MIRSSRRQEGFIFLGKDAIHHSEEAMPKIHEVTLYLYFGSRERIGNGALNSQELLLKSRCHLGKNLPKHQPPPSFFPLLSFLSSFWASSSLPPFASWCRDGAVLIHVHVQTSSIKTHVSYKRDSFPSFSCVYFSSNNPCAEEEQTKRCPEVQGHRLFSWLLCDTALT